MALLATPVHAVIAAWLSACEIPDNAAPGPEKATVLRMKLSAVGKAARSGTAIPVPPAPVTMAVYCTRIRRAMVAVAATVMPVAPAGMVRAQVSRATVLVAPSRVRPPALMKAHENRIVLE